MARFEQLREGVLKLHGITIASLLAELNEARTIALGQTNPNAPAAITATMSKAKLVGLDRAQIDVYVTGINDSEKKVVKLAGI